jgi:predicted glycosyltransferase
MKILIDMGHPAHVHLFKNFIWEMEKKGHELIITARDKEVTKNLLDAYHIPYTLIGKPKTGFFSLYSEWIIRTIKIIQIGKKTQPDVFIATVNPAAAFAAEHAILQNSLTFPITDIIVTPSCFRQSIGSKQIRYFGYHELAYLHPRYFDPNPSVLKDLGLSEEDRYIVIRFVSWKASHDAGQGGIRNKVEFVKKLERYAKNAKIFISSEGSLDKSLSKYQLKVPPEKLHDLLYYATLYIGEGATVASEAAVLGTNAIYVNTLTAGTLDDQEKYGLLFNFSNRETMEQKAFDKAVELLGKAHLKEEGKMKRELLLHDKIDVTEFMVNLVERTINSKKM